MNNELKSIIAVIFDGVTIEQDVAGKKPFVVMIPDVFALVGDLSHAISHFQTIVAELVSLKGDAEMADLVAFIESEVKKVTSDPKIIQIILMILKIIQNNVHALVDLKKVTHATQLA